MRDELARARRYSLALRHLLGTGIEPATYDEHLCDWSGPLLPIEPIDYRNNVKPIAHGTYKGFMQHKTHGTKPCEPCRIAKREYNRANEAKRRQRKRESDQNGFTTVAESA